MKVNPGDLVRMKGERGCYIVMEYIGEGDSLPIKKVTGWEEPTHWVHPSLIEQVIATAVCEPPINTGKVDAICNLDRAKEAIREVMEWLQRT